MSNDQTKFECHSFMQDMKLILRCHVNKDSCYGLFTLVHYTGKIKLQAGFYFL